MTRDPAVIAPIEGLRVDLSDLARARPRGTARLRMAAAIALSLILHAAPLLVLDRDSADVEPVEEAIPVEIVVEPPAPDPAPAEPEPAEQPKPEQPQSALDEKPVSDFVRSTDQDEKEGKDAPRPEARPAETPPQKALPPDPDGAEPASPASPHPPVEPAPSAAPDMRDEAFLPPLPDYQFESPARRSSDPRGAADPGYLSTLYGRIMKQMQAPAPAGSSRRIHGRIVFGISSSGHVIQETVAMPSGRPDLDRAALAAIRRAAPFPKPPNGGPLFIRFDYGSR